MQEKRTIYIENHQGKMTNDRIDKLFADIEDNFRLIGEQNKEELEEAFIKPIHDKYPFAQNGICALIASMGSGKSYNYLKFVCQQEVLNKSHPFYELVVICSTSAKFDKTVETYKRLITKSKLVCVQDIFLLDWLNKYMRRVLKYNAINDFLKNNTINEELMRLFTKHNLNSEITQTNKDKRFVVAIDHQNKPTISYNVLAPHDKDSGLILTSNDKMEVISCETPNKQTFNVESREYRIQTANNSAAINSLHQKRLKYVASKLSKYKWKTNPHRCLLILDDFASHPLLRSKETEMSRLLKKLRHFNINVIICVQTVKSISKDIKRTLSDIILFPGISFEDFNDLMKESPASMFDRKQLYNEYTKLTNPHDMFRIHIKAKRIIVNHSLMNNK